MSSADDSSRRPIAFVLASTDHGPLILNRLDYCDKDGGRPFGVGFDLLEESAYDPTELSICLDLLAMRRQRLGNGVVVVDCGANVGVYTVQLAKKLTQWGVVVAFEPQERIFYALAGNIALNNCFNARAVYAAVSRECGRVAVPAVDYCRPGSFGSLSLEVPDTRERAVELTGGPSSIVHAVTLDSLALERIDLIKIDVEGMEFGVVLGGLETIRRCHPALLVEVLKTDAASIKKILAEHGYSFFQTGINLFAVHSDDLASRDLT